MPLNMRCGISLDPGSLLVATRSRDILPRILGKMKSPLPKTYPFPEEDFIARSKSFFRQHCLKARKSILAGNSPVNFFFQVLKIDI
jgi:hypothetical protein